MRYDSRFTRSGNGKRSKSGARVRRSMERGDRDGWEKRRTLNQARYERWEKSFQNVKAHDKYGNTFWVVHRPQLIHKGSKP